MRAGDESCRSSRAIFRTEYSIQPDRLTLYPSPWDPPEGSRRHRRPSVTAPVALKAGRPPMR